tara:strand:+ start:180 stop:515 length:336 start_codon:yes stop_codon:yes gene_type:complete
MVSLWKAVILQSLLDAGDIGVETTQANLSQFKKEKIVQEAQEWFTQPNTDFEDVCTFAGMDERVVRAFALRVIKGEGNARKALQFWQRQNQWMKRKENNNEQAVWPDHENK